MKPSWTLVEDSATLDRVVREASASGVVAVDTEFMRRNTFYPQVALLQLCYDEHAWLVDPLALEDTTPVSRLLQDRAVLKVMHSASEDLEVFQHWLQAQPQPLFDTQRAAALLGQGFGLGYRQLVANYCGEELPKGEQRSDWLQRPLTESQCNYAAMDVTYLLAVWRLLHEEAREQNKIDWILADGEDAVRQAASGENSYHGRIKNAWKLDRRQLASLMAICDWREQVARRANKPRGWIIDDRACLALAQEDPRNRAELSDRVELPPAVLRRRADELLAILDRQREKSEEALPQRLPGPLDAEQRKRLKALKGKAREIAGALGTEPEVLLPSRDYELLLREEAGELPEEPAYWSGWRRDAVLSPLRTALTGSKS